VPHVRLNPPRLAVGRTWADKDGRSPFQGFCYASKKTAAKSKGSRAMSESI
jgi:hypothetical protein